MNERNPDAWRATMKRRIAITAVLVIAWAGIVQLRLVHLQVIRHHELLDAANSQLLDRRDIPGRRGKLLDRNGRVLATSVVVRLATAAPKAVVDPRKTADQFCRVLNCSPADRDLYVTRMSSGKDSVWLRRQISTEDAKQIAALKLKGIDFLPEDKRFYPNRELAAHVLGFVGTEHKGLDGIESRYNDIIAGALGSVRMQVDASRQAVGAEIEQPPTEGATIELTIDETIQYIVERELRRGVLENKALGGCVTILDPTTGEILAMASWPTFNPNDFNKSPVANRRNRCVQDLYEPGSTFKLVTASAALEQGVVQPNDVIDVSGGRYVFGPGDVVSDTHEYKQLTFSDVIVKSSNVGAIKVALRLGAEHLTEYARRFGFGAYASRQDFPSETKGYVWPASALKDSALGRVSIGYQISVNALQVAAATSSIANGGELVRPRVVRAVWRNGQRLVVPRTVVNRTVPPHIASEMTTIMESVVTDGTATMAQIPGYTVAGKTGTATKWEDGHYIPDQHNASFVGFVPSRKPAYTIIVVIDSPKGRNGYYGGPVAGPIFKRIAEEVLRHGRIPPTLNAPPPLMVNRASSAPHERRVSSHEAPSTVVKDIVKAGRDGYFPDMSGMSARDAAGALARLGLSPTLLGTGLVRRQKPDAGSPIESGAKVTLWLDREPVPDGTGGLAP